MTDFQQDKFTGGLCLRPTATQLKAHQLQAAENCDFVREVGAVTPRRGIDKYYSRLLSADEAFWQNVLDTAGPIIRAGDRLYDGLRPVGCDITDTIARFEEYGDHVIVVNGYENKKYKQSGMGLTVHTAYMFDFEYDALIATQSNEDSSVDPSAFVQSFLHAYGDPLGEGDAEWRCTYEWERNYIEEDTLDEDSDDFYTHSSCEDKTINGTVVDVMDVCRAVNLGIPTGPAISAALGASIPNANAKLLIDFDEADTSTNFTDEAQGHTITANGAAQADTAQYKFGSASLLLDGDADYISLSKHSDFDFGDSEFGIDLWVRFNTVPSSTGFYGIYSQGDLDSGNDYFALYIYKGPTSKKLYIRHNDATLGDLWQLGGTWYPAADTWYHLYICRGWGSHASKWAICIDGVELISVIEYRTVNPIDADIKIGSIAVTSLATEYGIDGWVDEVRVVKGEAPWVADFTVPSAAYGLSLDGTYNYKATNVNYLGHEGNAGSLASVVPSEQVVNLTIPVSNDPQVVQRNIYRTEDSGSTYKLLVSINNNYQTTYDDVIGDGYLGDTLLTTQDEPPIFSEVHDRQSLLWGIEAANKNKIWYCNAFDDWDAFQSTNYETFGASSAESVALESLGEFLSVVQKSRIWKYNTEVDPEVLSDSYSAVGAPVGQAVFNLKDAILIVEAAGMYLFDAVKSIKFSQKIDPIFDSTGNYDERINSSYLTNIRACALDNRIYVSYTRTGQTANDRTVVFDRELDSFQGVIQQGFTSLTADKETKVVLGVGTDGYVYQLETGNDDDGSAIAWNFRTKDFADELVGGSLEVSDGGLTQKAKPGLVWKRGGKIRFDIDPAGDTMTITLYYDGTLRQTRDYSDASRTVKEFRLEPDYDFTRISIDVSGSTDALQKFYSFRLIGVEVVGEGE